MQGAGQAACQGLLQHNLQAAPSTCAPTRSSNNISSSNTHAKPIPMLCFLGNGRATGHMAFDMTTYMDNGPANMQAPDLQAATSAPSPAAKPYHVLVSHEVMQMQTQQVLLLRAQHHLSPKLMQRHPHAPAAAASSCCSAVATADETAGVTECTVAVTAERACSRAVSTTTWDRLL